MSILRYKDSNGQWTELPLLEGPPGMSAYEHAVAGGYDGTLEEFEELLNAVVNIDEAEELGIDGNPIENSNNLITSGGVYSALNGKEDQVFNVEYGVTTFTEIKNASDAGKICQMKINADGRETRIYYLVDFNSSYAFFLWTAQNSNKRIVTCTSDNVWSDEISQPLQLQSISDAGNYFSADTVEGALQELGAAKLNPTSKTSAMTQEVGKDDNGKLWTTPGGGGGSSVQEVFVAEYGETTLEEVNEAFTADKICICRIVSRTYYAVQGGSNSAIFVWHGINGQKRAIYVNSTGWSDEIDCNTLQASSKVTEITSSSTDTQIPSAKAVYDFVMSLDSSEVLY